MVGQHDHLLQTPPRLLLAPMMDVTETCIAPRPDTLAFSDAGLQQACASPADGSAAQLVNQTLRQFAGSTGVRNPDYLMGYTLAVPLLHLFTQADSGLWQINQEAVERYARTIRDAQYPAIVYLFSTHFSSAAPLEKELARDAQNLAHTQNGPLEPSDYFGAPLYGWSIAQTGNALTRYRMQAIDALGQAICAQGPATVSKVAGLTLLGEVHQLFPQFATGAGYSGPYLITDYSHASRMQFTAWLQQQYHHSLAHANRALHSDYADWASIAPPGEDLHNQPEALQTRLHAHMDAYAHGKLPISGWVYVPDEKTHALSRIVIFHNGEFLARVPINQGRQDVLDSRPEFGARPVGWQYMLDFRAMPSGAHQFDIYLQTHPAAPLQKLDSKTLTLRTLQRTASQTAPASRNSRTQQHLLAPALKAATPAPEVAFYVDLPHSNRTYVHNPLAEQWHAFRRVQVLRYLQAFEHALDDTCLADKPRYTHQIVPHTNPGWDTSKFAIEQTLRPLHGLQLGVSLYGEPGMSADFISNLKIAGHQSYGVTEFHPLKPLSPDAVRQTLELHRHNGAAFFSFFLEPMWDAAEVPRISPNPFAFSPGNTFKGSDATYASLQQVLASGEPRQRTSNATLKPAPAAPSAGATARPSASR